METQNELAIFQAENGAIELRTDVKNATVWVTQKQIAEIFGIDRSVVTKHINKIIVNKQIDEKSNVHFLHIANSDKRVKFYTLDVVLTVGYRTNSAKVIDFRVWATKILKQHITEGYTINAQTIERNKIHFLKI